MNSLPSVSKQKARWLQLSSSSGSRASPPLFFGPVRFLDVVALEAESVMFFALAASVNADGGTTKGDCPDLHLKGKIGPKGVLVEFDGAKVVGRPDGIFYFLTCMTAN